MHSPSQSNTLVDRLKLRLSCFTVNWLNIDWDLFDLKFLDEFNIIGYLLKTSFNSMPIRYFKCEKNQTNSQVLEETFKLSRETFNLNNNNNNGSNSTASFLKSEIMRVLTGIDATVAIVANTTTAATPSRATINETDETEENSTKSQKPADTTEPDEDEDSFDMKIFPKLYQSLFQANGGAGSSNTTAAAAATAKPFDTDALLKCLSTEIKTYEHYEKFIVARYMFWKYYAKLRANFYCDECEVMLVENRYVCLECREHCLCFNCFAKSCIDTSSSDSVDCPANTNANKWNGKKQANNFYCTHHKASHRMLLLDHLCDKCGSLIIGKRIHCEECDNFDLCLMCYKRFEQQQTDGAIPIQKNIHTKEHKITIVQPVIIVSKPECVLDIQVYLYLNTQMLFSIFTIKLSTLMANIDTFSRDQLVIICSC